MKERLTKAKDPEIFKMVRHLSGSRTVPFMINSAGRRITSHQDISEEISKQLVSDEVDTTNVMENKPLNIDISMSDLKSGLDALRSNTAAGHDGVSYRFC